MSPKAPSVLLRLELLIGVIFFLIFSVWAVRKCNVTREQYRQAAAREAAEEREGAAADSAAAVAAAPRRDSAAAAPSSSVVRERVTPLYVTVEGLNLRTEPKLNSQVIDQLKLGDEVVFMNEVTSFRDSISMGAYMAYEPWVKVKSRKGRVGWVYGAGVEYYKAKKGQ